MGGETLTSKLARVHLKVNVNSIWDAAKTPPTMIGTYVQFFST